MFKRILATIIVIIAGLFFILLFIPFLLIWFITGKDFLSAYTGKVFHIFEYMIKP